MNGEKIKIFGYTYTHFTKEVKSPNFQPTLHHVKDIKRKKWTLKKRINCCLISCAVGLILIIVSLVPIYIGKPSIYFINKLLLF